MSLHQPKSIDGRMRRLGLDQRLAEVEGEADAEEHQRDADGDVVDPRQAADRRMHRRRAGAPDSAGAARTPSQGEPVR